MLAMRILEIVDVRWWNACAYYGVELSRGLAAAGEAVVVAGSPGSPPIQQARALGLQVWTDVRFADPNPLHTAADLGALVRGLRQFDLVDAHRAEGHVLGALARALSGTAPVVRTRGDIRSPRRHPLNRWLYRRLTAAVVVPGEFMRTRLMDELDLSADQIEVIPAGVDLEHFHPGNHGNDDVAELRRKLGIGPDEPVVGMVARLSPVKGHRVMIDALARLAEGGLRPHLLVAGQEEEVAPEDLLADARAAAIGDRVHLLGKLADVRPALAAIDVLAVASLGSEAISRALLEGMAMARPAVATRVGVIPELVVEGETGFLVPAGDAAAMAGALRPLLLDRGRARAMGERARARAEAEYGLDRWVARTRALYRQVASEHGRNVHARQRSGS
jgi:glycosyltransferase involved in cell wall biosynthesis